MWLFLPLQVRQLELFRTKCRIPLSESCLVKGIMDELGELKLHPAWPTGSPSLSPSMCVLAALCVRLIQLHTSVCPIL